MPGSGLPASSCGWSAAGPTTVGLAPGVERLLPELKAHKKDVAAELRRRTHAPVASGRLSITDRPADGATMSHDPFSDMSDEDLQQFMDRLQQPSPLH